VADVPSHRVDGIVFLSLGIVEWINLFRPHMFFPYYASSYIGSSQDPAQTFYIVMRVEMMDIVVESIHAILMPRESSKESSPAGRAAAD